MDAKQFREFGNAAVDFIAEYMETMRDRDVIPSVEPGYLQELVPNEAPEHPESWQEVMKDMNRVIMPGVTHWHSPNFHAYYPTGNSYPSMVGELLCSGLGMIGFSWISSPVCTELEVVVMNWLGKMLGLPEEFLNSSEGPGGGVIQGSASEATFVCLLAARERTVRQLRAANSPLSDEEIRSKLVAYTSEQANSSVEKAGILAAIPMRLLKSNENCELTGETLESAIKEDIDKGLIPCYVVGNIGTTGTCAFDRIDEIGPICKSYDLWLHIDAAYAGTAFICPEYRHLMPDLALCDSFNFNPHKWMPITFDCSALWVRNSYDLINAFNVDRIYLKHKHQDTAPDYRHWQIPLGRRFRALKVWIVLRTYGITGIQNHVRKHVSLADYFTELVSHDERFEVLTKSLALTCFRLKGDDEKTKYLLDKLMERKQIYCIPCKVNGKLVVRFVICSGKTEKTDIDFAWNEMLHIVNENENSERKSVKFVADDIEIGNKGSAAHIEVPQITENEKVH